MEFMGVAGVAAIGVIAYLIGEAVKISPADNKYIPVICGTAGALLGVAAMYTVPLGFGSEGSTGSMEAYSTGRYP